MTRLPKPGEDNGNWGEILNDFLEQSHNGDGSIKEEAIPKSTNVTTDGSSDTKIPSVKAIKDYTDGKVSEINTELGEITKYDVKNYGAKGDGVTDDTLAIQSAFNNIASDGGVLYIPTGVYLVSGLTLDNRAKSPMCRVYIYGDGWNSVLKLKDGSNKDLIYATWCDRAIFTHFRLNGNKAHNTSGSCLVLTDNSAYACVEGMEIHDAPEYGVSVVGDYDPENPTNYLYTDEVHIDQSFIYWCGKSGVHMDGVGGCIISNSELEYNNEHGICTTYDGISGSNGHIITGCNILSNLGCGIYLYTSSRVLINGNVIGSNEQHGIYTEGGGQNRIADNQIEDNCKTTHAEQIKSCYQDNIWVSNNAVVCTDQVNPSSNSGFGGYDAGVAYFTGNSFKGHTYGSVYVYGSSSYKAQFNEGIVDQ